MSKFKVVLDQNICIGCNTCPLVDPATFEMDNTIFKAKVKAQPETITDAVKTAVSCCPVTAISIIEEE